MQKLTENNIYKDKLENFNVDPKYKEFCNAVYNLQPEKVKEILENFNLADYKNIFPNDLLSDIFTYLTDRKIHKTKKNEISLKIVKIGYGKNYNFCEKLFLEIIEIICIKFFHLINYDAYQIAKKCHIKSLHDLLKKYYTGDEENKICVNCKKKSFELLINLPCSCKEEYIHFECLVNIVSHCGNYCNKCSGNFGSVKENGLIHFPKLNIYHKFPSYTFINDDDIFKKLTYACAFIQVERVTELLNTLNNEEFKKFIDKKAKEEPYVFVINELDNTTSLQKKLPSYLNFDVYKERHIKINNLLHEKYIIFMEYICKTDIKVYFGKYSYKNEIGYTITNYENCLCQYMLYINLEYNLKLKTDANCISIYSQNEKKIYNKLINKIEEKELTIFIKLDDNENKFGTELKIIFSKKDLNKSDNLKIVYTTFIKIPELKILGNTEQCNICLENVNLENKFITPCGHLFHDDCNIQYLKSKNFVNKYECAVCKTPIKLL